MICLCKQNLRKTQWLETPTTLPSPGFLWAGLRKGSASGSGCRAPVPACGPVHRLQAGASHRPAPDQAEENQSPLFDGAVGKFQKSTWESTLPLASEGLWVETPGRCATCPPSDICSSGGPLSRLALETRPCSSSPGRSGRILLVAHRNWLSGDKDLVVHSGCPGCGQPLGGGLRGVLRPDPARSRGPHAAR